MSNFDKIRAKISALMKKTEANGASEAEAASAMAIASKLMAEHGVTLADIKDNTAAAHDFSKRHVNPGAKNMTVVDKFVATAIARYTDTKVWNSKEFETYRWYKKGPKPKFSSNLMFYGYSVDVELAEYIYKICDSAVEMEWKKFARTIEQGARAKARVSFQLGMSLRLRDRLIGMKKVVIEETNGSSLVVLKTQLVDASFKNNVTENLEKGVTPNVRYTAGKVFEAGKNAAESVLFNREVHDGPQGGVKLIA